MTRQEILNSLSQVAATLTKQRQNIRIVAVGGSINPVVLCSRQATHDVAFFAESMTRQQAEALQQATRRIATRSQPQLATEWLNSRTTLFIDRSIRQQLEQDAVRQNTMLF